MDPILERGQGNPFFLEEVIHALIDSEMLCRREEAWHAREGTDQTAVPASVQSVILSRVDHSSLEARQVLTSASVMGRLFRRRLLEQMAAPPTGIERELWELQERGLIYQERMVPEEEYSFKHVLTQETIYGSLLCHQRAALHQQVGAAIESLYGSSLEEQYEQLAYHYERSDADDKAVQYLLKAGEKLRQAYLNEVAIGCFQRALERLAHCGLRIVDCGLGATGQSAIHDPQSAGQCRLAALKGLAQLYLSVGRIVEAEERSRQAITLAKEMGLPARDIVRLYSALAESLWWQGRLEAMRSVGEEGLALLGDDTESVEAALMNDTLAMSGSSETWRAFTYRNVPFVGRLPYSAELRAVYSHIYYVYKSDRNLDEANRWLQSLERQARQHHDLTALGEVYRYSGELMVEQGDLRGGVGDLKRALEQMVAISDAKHQGMYECSIGLALLSLGDVEEAADYTERAARTFGVSQSKGGIARNHLVEGTLQLCQGLAGEAAVTFEKAAQLFQESDDPLETRATLFRGRACIVAGNRQEALTLWRDVVARERADPWELAAALSSLEEAYQDAEAFRAFCRGLQQEPLFAPEAVFTQWFLQPADLHPFSHSLITEDWAAAPSSEWVWQDPFGDSSFVLQNGLEVRAANGRDLRHLNLSAPRLLRAAAGDFAVQTILLAPPGRPAIGGILLWKDRENFLRLERGTRGTWEVSFQGCLDNRDVIIGRGRLPGERLFLRLERRGGHVRALCSSDDQAWFTVGQTEFPTENPLEVGLHAIGSIDRTIYPGAYPNGTAIGFQSFGLWV
jgi:tetratricopeptide (TPR) repeat protein